MKHGENSVCNRGQVDTSVLCGNRIAQFAPDCLAQYCSKVVIASWKVSDGAPTRLEAAAPLVSRAASTCLSVAIALAHADVRATNGLLWYAT